MSITSKLFKLLALGASAAAATALHAQITYHVSLDTSGLGSSTAAPFYIDFQLFDGTGLGNGNTSIAISRFNFGSGSPDGTATTSGGAMGSLGSDVSLTDTSFLNEFYQPFTAGDSLQFDVQISSSPQGGDTPDSFAFALLDNTLANLPTLADASDVFALVEIGDAGTSVQSFASNPALPPAAGGDALSISAPSIQPVPEPSTYGLVAAAGLAAAALLRRRNRLA